MARKNYRQNYYKVPVSRTGYILIFILMFGIVLGFLVTSLIFKNDTFELNGNEYYSFEMSDTDNYEYIDEGATVICFNKNLSKNVKVETDLECENGSYIIPLNVAGEYTIKYSVDCFKYGDNFITERKVLIRKFVVEAKDE